MKEPLHVLSFGARTPVGLDAPSTCAAIRAGVPALGESRFFHAGRALEPVVAASVPDLKTESGFERLVALAAPALAECVSSLGTDPARAVLFLSVREPHRTGTDLDSRETELLREIQARAGFSFRPESAVLPAGPAGVMKGLRAAADLRSPTAPEAFVVGGVDSWLNAEDVERLRASWRLAGPRVAQGMFPGEGAAFLGVARRRPAAGSRGRIAGVGLAEEAPESTALGGGPATGRGLRAAMESALKDAEMPESAVGFRVSDLNGEAFRGMESALAAARCFRTRREEFPIWHPADCVGDVGAAAGALLPIVALTALEKGYAPAETAVCEASSEGRLRGACLVQGTGR
jgi:3-oxoacyl-[acyl-carrier-protein] synthase-1